MPLPVANDKIAGWTPEGLIKAKEPANSPFANNTNIEHKAKRGKAVWDGHTLKFAKPKGDDDDNYWYLPAVQDKVSYCVVPSNRRGDIYVLSDQYGGCELHVLQNAAQHLFAFLHIYRGGGHTVAYARAAGWAEVYQRRSAHIARAGGMSGSNLSISWVHGGNADSTFVHVQGNAPPLNVTIVNDGTAPY